MYKILLIKILLITGGTGSFGMVVLWQFVPNDNIDLEKGHMLMLRLTLQRFPGVMSFQNSRDTSF